VAVRGLVSFENVARMSKPSKGKVYLVGAGPGDPGLLTVKGLKCLQIADLVLYDGLVNPLLLRFTSAATERTKRTELEAARAAGQEQINRRLIDEARAGKIVVRLKGGDPFIFGRGSEEAAALAEAGVDFEVVPGVTAAVAAGEYAGLSFTHREYASAVAFITGHEDPSKDRSSLDYEAIAKFPGTLVFYMALHRLEGLVEDLLRAGKPASTPACVISSATNPAQRTITSPLSELASAARNAGLCPPSIVVVGECVSRREAIAWFEKRPLFGRRIGITRPVAQAGPVIERVLELGAEPVLLPTIEILPVADFVPIDTVVSRLTEFDWLVFTSVNGVEAFMSRVWFSGRDARHLAGLRIASIGPATAASMLAYGVRPDLTAHEFRAESLAADLGPHVAGRRVLWAHADRAREVLPDELSRAGATVEEIVVYRNVDVQKIPAETLARVERGELDWIALGSPAIVQSLKSLCTPAALAQLNGRTRLASIGPVTTARATELGLKVAAEATEYTWEGLLAAIVRAELS
jgi:uroporphyrinogen III methyltransferase / synthase